jgi:hypothetical protein
LSRRLAQMDAIGRESRMRRRRSLRFASIESNPDHRQSGW